MPLLRNSSKAYYSLPIPIALSTKPAGLRPLQLSSTLSCGCVLRVGERVSIYSGGGVDILENIPWSDPWAFTWLAESSRCMQAYSRKIPLHAPPRGDLVAKAPGGGRPTRGGRPTPPVIPPGSASSGALVCLSTSSIRVPPLGFPSLDTESGPMNPRTGVWLAGSVFSP